MVGDGARAGAAIDVAGLRKDCGGIRGGRRAAFDGLDLHVDGGGRVHGFLGPCSRR